MKYFLQKNWFGILSVTSSFIILASLIFSEGIGNFFSVIKHIQPKFLLAAFIGIILYCIFDGYILFVLTKIKYKSYNFFHSLKTCLIGLFYSAITPLSIGGQPMQIIEMTQSNIKFGDACSFIIIKTIAYQTILILYSLPAIFLHKNFNVPNFWYITTLGLTFNLIFILAIILICIKKDLVIKICHSYIKIFSRTKFFRIKNPDITTQKTIEQINLFHESAKLISNKKLFLAIIFLLTAFQTFFYYSIAYFVLKSFSISCDITYVIFVASLIYMITTFVPIPGASGANESAFYIFFRFLLPKSLIVPIIFVWRFITYYFLIFIGGIIIIIDMIKHRPF